MSMIPFKQAQESQIESGRKAEMARRGLPQYSTHERATVLRVVATPLAVTADTTIVCAVIGAFVFSNGGAAAVIR